VGETRTRGLR